MIQDLLFLAAGCALLYVGAERLISSAMELGRVLRMSATVTGLVIVAIGTSLPELAVSIDAAVHEHGAIAIGNVVGSNIVNITLVVGAGALIGGLAASQGVRRWDMPALVGLTFLAIILLLDGQLSRLDGLLLLVSVTALLIRRVCQPAGAVHVPASGSTGSNSRHVFGVLLGVVLLVAGAEAMVASGIGLAQALGVSEAVIALTVTAVGTGIPEIAATLVAVGKGQGQMALGNIVGSNLINLGVVLGLTGLIAPVAGPEVGLFPLVMLGAMTFGLWLVVSLSPLVHRWAGVLLVSLFGVYQLAVVT